MKPNLFMLYATIGFSLSLSAAPSAEAAPSLYCAGLEQQMLQEFRNENNPFLLKLGFGNVDRDLKKNLNGTKISSQIENGQWLDHSDLMKKYYNQKFTYNRMSLNQLKRNINSYEAVKAAKELGLYIGGLSLPCIDENGHREALAELTAYLMKMKPLDISEAVDAEVKKQLNMELEEASEKNADEVNKILQAQLKIAIRAHTAHLKNVISDALFRDAPNRSLPEYKAVEKHLLRLILPVVRLAYMDHQIGRTQWVGRALIGLQLRNGGDEALPVLKKELAENGVIIENYAGEQWLLDSENSNLKEVEDAFAAKLTKLHSENKITLAQALKMKDDFDKGISGWFQKKDQTDKQDGQTPQKKNEQKLSLKGLSNDLKNTWSALKNKNISELAGQAVDKVLGSMQGVSEKLTKAFSYTTKQMPIPVHTMSYVLTRNINFESALTPSLALPGNMEKGREFNLIGSLLSGINVVDADYVKDNGYGLVAQLKDRSFYRVLNNGFSHIGYVAVRRADGVSMTWMIDNYPTPTADAEIDVAGGFNAGGIRWVGLEQFYKASQHSRITVMTPDPALFRQYAQPQIQKWMEQIDQGKEILGTKMFSAYKPELDASGKPVKVENPVDDPWTMEIDSAAFKKIHEHEDANAWFNSVTEAAMDKIQDFMYQGMAFVWITPYGQYYKGGAYCSFTGVLGYGLGTGLNPLSTGKDKWSDLIQSLAKIHSEAKKRLETTKDAKIKAHLKAVVENGTLKDATTAVSVDIYTPSGLPAQSYVLKAYQAQAPFRDVFSRYDLLFDKTSKVSAEVSLTVGPSEEKELLLNVELDSSETTGILLDLLEVTDVKYPTAK